MLKYIIMLCLLCSNALAAEKLSEQKLVSIASVAFEKQYHWPFFYDNEKSFWTEEKDGGIIIYSGKRPPSGNNEQPMVDGVPPSVTLNPYNGKVIDSYPGCC